MIKNETPKKKILERVKIIALNSYGMAKKTIAWFVKKSLKTIYRWISRYKQINDLSDKTRSGRPITFKEDIKLRIIAFYLQSNSISGCKLKSFSWAEMYLNENPEILDCKISRSLIYRILTEHALKPHRNKYFLNIIDPLFFQKMQHIIDLYMNLPKY